MEANRIVVAVWQQSDAPLSRVVQYTNSRLADARAQRCGMSIRRSDGEKLGMRSAERVATVNSFQFMLRRRSSTRSPLLSRLIANMSPFTSMINREPLGPSARTTPSLGAVSVCS